jgi:hypothetical protein
MRSRCFTARFCLRIALPHALQIGTSDNEDNEYNEDNDDNIWITLKFGNGNGRRITAIVFMSVLLLLLMLLLMLSLLVNAMKWKA